MEEADATSGGWKSLQFGGSLPVDNVQALAASKALTEIPRRYVRSDVEADFNGMGNDEIPVIDLGRLLDLLSSEDEAAKLKFACEEWGFFQLINHGVPEEVIKRMKVDIEEFFKLPLEEKQAYMQLPGSIEGYGQAFVVSEEQQLDWADMYFLGTQPVALRNMRFWSTHPPTFRETLDKYSIELKRVADCLLGCMTKNLGLHQELINLFNNGLQSVRINYYPPCPHANKVLGLSPHSDTVGLTILLQVNQVLGLQIKRNGHWLPIKPIPGAFIINVGDVLEALLLLPLFVSAVASSYCHCQLSLLLFGVVSPDKLSLISQSIASTIPRQRWTSPKILSNGRYKSIEHRAVINPEEERMSIAAFHSPNHGALIGPLPKLVEGTQHYKTVDHENYVRMNLSAKLDGKNLLALMKLKD